MNKRKGWIIFFLITGFFLFMSFMFVLGIKMAFEDKPIVKKDTILQLNLVGTITEHYPQDAFSKEFEGANMQLHDIRQALEMAELDNRVRGVFMRIAFPGLGWAMAREIRDELLKFKESGKFVTAYLDYCNEQGYFIGLAADEIYLQPHSITELNGFKSEIPFIKRMFNKLGIAAQVINIGKYKNAGDIYNHESMSPEQRESTEAILNAVYENFVNTVSEQRQIERSAFENLLQQ